MCAHPQTTNDFTLLRGTALVPVLIDDGSDVCLITASAPPAVEAAICSHCNGAMAGHGQRRLIVADIPVHDRPVTLHIDVPRLRCTLCNRTYSPRPEDLDPARQMTKRLVALIEQQGLERPFAEIARKVGIGEATVAQICHAYILRLDALHQPIMPQILSIDEVHMRLGRAFCVISDFHRNTVIEMLPDTKQKTVENALRRLREPERCRISTMDMCPHYRRGMHNVLPGATIVIDKWHVTDTARRGMLSVLERVYKRLRKPKGLTRFTLRGWLIKQLNKLSRRTRKVLNKILAQNALLAEAHRIKEKLYRLHDLPDLATARGYLGACVAAISPGLKKAFSDLITATKNWGDDILAYWSFPEQVTNARAEGLNAVIKRINASGGGYMPFELLRARVLFGEPQRRARETARELARRQRRAGGRRGGQRRAGGRRAER